MISNHRFDGGLVDGEEPGGFERVDIGHAKWIRIPALNNGSLAEPAAFFHCLDHCVFVLFVSLRVPRVLAHTDFAVVKGRYREEDRIFIFVFLALFVI